MKKIKQRLSSNAALILLLTVAIITFSTNAFSADAAEIMEKSNNAYFYAGDDGRADVTMKLINKSGKERLRVFTMLRQDTVDGGEQKYYIYFHKPGDVKKTTFLVIKNIESDDSRWLFIPVINMVKRIAASDKHSSFVGSDFSYEDVSGRVTSDDTHELVKEDKVGEYDVYVIKSTPKEKSAFSHVTHYIDKKTSLPIKREYYNKKGEVYKLFESLEIKTVQDIPTVTKRKMTDIKKKHHTTVDFDKIDYNLGVEDNIFSERFLKAPPKKWIK
ncbi:outer membrane lipoprotein-sorting protein [Thermodesulfobacteriota bacterium]